MLEEASNKGVYSELHEHTLGNPAEFPNQWKNKFDFATCAGLVNNNHMDYQIFEEMLLSVKKGGYLIFLLASAIWATIGTTQSSRRCTTAAGGTSSRLTLSSNMISLMRLALAASPRPHAKCSCSRRHRKS
jgi:hypothetical protein